MPRIARIVIPKVPHHITQRGNNKQDVFRTVENRWFYLQCLKQECKNFGVSVLGYCLMSNHIHIVAIPETTKSLDKGIGRTNLRYTQYYNWLHGRSGHLWQGRFFSCAMDETHTVYSLRYADQNPALAGLVVRPWDYPWSSAAAHTGESDTSGLLDLDWWKKNFSSTEWREILQQDIPESTDGLLRRHLRTGWPLGSDRFVEALEKQMNRRMRPKSGGKRQHGKKSSR